jgi:hypothetical protein
VDLRAAQEARVSADVAFAGSQRRGAPSRHGSAGLESRSCAKSWHIATAAAPIVRRTSLLTCVLRRVYEAARSRSVLLYLSKCTGEQMPCRSSNKERNCELGACGAFLDRCKHDAIIAALVSPAVRPDADPAAPRSFAARGSELHPRNPQRAKMLGCAAQTERWKSKRCGWNPKKRDCSQ